VKELLACDPKDGLQIVCYGRIGVYGQKGKYQLYLEKIYTKGVGELQRAFEQLKEKLKKEGLFDAKRKRPIPLVPKKIGIVTSLTGAALRDILDILNRRFADVEILIRPARVQGKGAARQIAQGIRDVNEHGGSDVIIVGRGGGSLEDLWAFNEEEVARAIFASRIPVISAVGHEIDFTIADMVADMRASTPSDAAKRVIGEKQEIAARLEAMARKAQTHIMLKVQTAMHDLTRALSRRALEALPEALVHYTQRIDELMAAQGLSLERNLQGYSQRYAVSTEKLNALNPFLVLARGYSVTEDARTGGVITDAAKAQQGDRIKTRLRKGVLVSTIEEIHKDVRLEK
jgi:exodeoxyribonuclease VII large subunit